MPAKLSAKHIKAPNRIKKWKDRELNPEWLESNERRQIIEGSGYAVEDFYPEDYDKKLSPDGGWIMLLMTVRVAKDPDGESEPVAITVPRLSIWYATPTVCQNGAFQAVIQTKSGAVHVWPHEYKCIDIGTWLEFSENDGLNIHFLSEGTGFDEAAMFYIRSRGIGQAEARRMLLATLKDPYYCYFTFDEAIANCFSEGTGTGYLMPHNHARRAASRRKMAGVAHAQSEDRGTQGRE